MTLYSFNLKPLRRFFAQQEELARVSKEKDRSLARHWATLKGWEKRNNKLLKRK